MKKIFLATILTLVSILCLGQNYGPIKFLGIPIDGSESQFTSKLQSKGFSYNSLYKSYKGQFNGKPVDVYIHTNHDLVDRVMVAFQYTDKENIKHEFNRLLSQFNDSGKYMDLSLNSAIPLNEDISYEIDVHSKNYQASFSYFDQGRDMVAFTNDIIDIVKDFYNEEQLTRLKNYCLKAVSAPESEQAELLSQAMDDLQNYAVGQYGNDQMNEEEAVRYIVTLYNGFSSLADGDVWFTIHENYGQYQICLYYDNLHNQAHGEDL